MLEQNQSRTPTTIRMSAGGWVFELLPANAYQADYVASTRIIGFAFDVQTGVHAYASSRICPFRASPSSLANVPQGCDVVSESSAGGEYLCLSRIPSSSEVATIEVQFNNVFVPHAVNHARVIRRLMLRPDLADPLLLDYHAERLVDCADQYLAAKTYQRIKRSAMTEHQLTVVDELIEEHLCAGLTIEFLAKRIGVSKGHFSRAFRAAMGKTPFDYIIDRRVSRARKMLQQCDSNLTTIANSCGFASHAHMTETFRQRVGLAPSQLREALFSRAIKRF